MGKLHSNLGPWHIWIRDSSSDMVSEFGDQVEWSTPKSLLVGKMPSNIMCVVNIAHV